MVKRILGLLGWLGVALVFAAVAIRFLRPEWQQYYNALAIAGLVCTLLYILSQWREIGQAFAGRQARFGTLAAASVLIVLAILVAINYLGSRHNKRWDLTAARQYSLSDQTKKVLKDLKDPVKIRVFARSDEFQRFRDRLDEYSYQSKQVQIEYIDPEKKPAVAQQYGVTSLGTIVFDYKGRTEKVTGDGEQELTNALIKVVQGRQPKVYFTQGHGEKDTTSADRGGYNGINSALASDNFVVDKLVLAQQTAVPGDADVLIIAGPKTDFLAGEIEMLKAYLARGGKILLMLDPVLKADAQQPAALQALLKDWGIEADNDIVLDVSGAGRLALGTDESVPVAATYPPHPITENFNLLTAYPLARSMTPVEGGVSGHVAQKLVETSRNSWGETNLKSLTGGQPAKLDEGDKKGPVSLAAAVSAPAANPPPAKEAAKPAETPKKPETRIVAFGDSDFASNAALGVTGNRDLFLNSVNWLAQQENLISIRPRDPEDRRITLTADQERRIFYLTVLLVPGLVLLAGVQTWWRRR
ncbi:MAG TPA: Gldg family protein [Vicinamibacterales bacterium]|nr:Gldg family protein [Vicinamibacterales bacterium]